LATTKKKMDFLLGLPPPPAVKKTRGPTRRHIPSGPECKFIESDSEGDEMPVLPAENPKKKEREYKFTAKIDFNESVLIRESMKNNDRKLELVPKIIVKGRLLPDSVSALCWWCKSKFTTKPVSCPYKYEIKSNSFRCEGLFCSYNCALAYAIDSKFNHFKFAASMLLKIRKAIDGINYSIPLTPAPHWSNLKIFGGGLNLRQFRNKSDNSVRIKSIPEALNIYLYGYNVFEHKKLRSQSVKTFQSLQNRVMPARKKKLNVRTSLKRFKQDRMNEVVLKKQKRTKIRDLNKMLKKEKKTLFVF